MLPILVSLGPVKIYSYGVCMAIGLFLSLYWWWKMGRDEHWDEIALFDGFFLSLIVFLISGRLGYVLSHLSEVGTIYRSLAFLAFPGINMIFGIVIAFIFLIFFARAHSWDEWKVVDASVVALSLLLVFGGIGGLLNGTSPGRAASWGLLYPGQTEKTIPVDIWIILWATLTFATLSKVRKNFRFYSWYKGESSTAQEGLAGIVFLLAVGIYFLVAAWIDQLSWKIGFVPGEFIVGLILIMIGGFMIYRRVGRRDGGMWSKLSNIIRRK